VIRHFFTKRLTAKVDVGAVAVGYPVKVALTEKL
jgi:hypothetical protein